MSRPCCLLQPALGVQYALRLGLCGQSCLLLQLPGSRVCSAPLHFTA